MTQNAEGFNGSLGFGTKPVVLSIDMMRCYFDVTSSFCLPSEDCLQSSARVIAVARRLGVPVIHTRVVFGTDGIDGGVFLQKIPALRGLIGEVAMNEIMPVVAPLPGELVIVKQYASAFFGTSLNSTVRAMGVDTVVILGVTTSGCIRATAVDAVQLGFIPIVVREAVGDRGPGPHEANLFDLQAKYADVLSEGETIANMEKFAHVGDVA